MSKIPDNPLILVDGSSYLFRAYHALPPLTTSKGQPTGAIFGVVNMLRKLIAEYNPKRMAVIFDSKEKNFRHALFSPYKANRVMMPEELQQQIAPLHRIIEAMGLPLVIMPGIEADDIIGSLAMIAKKHGLFTLISTGDKDFAQLVDEDIFLINTMSNDILDRNRIIEKFEVPPEQIIDYLALIGDTVDNIPGIPKVGPKTAIKWLQTYGSLQGVVDNANDVAGKIGENLRDNLHHIPLYKELVTIKLDVPLAFTPEDLLLKPADPAALKDIFVELELKSWLKELDKTDNGKESEVLVSDKTETLESLDPIAYETILTEAQFEAWLKKLKEAKQFVIDTETTSLDYMEAQIVGLSFAVNPNEAAYLPLMHDYIGAPQQLEREHVLQRIKPLLEDKNHLKIGHNLKYDLEVLANHDIHLQGIGFDTMLESYVLNSTGSRHDMDTLSEKHLNYKTLSFEDVAGKGVKQLTFNQVPIDKASFYAAEDADVTLKLHNIFWPQLSESPKQKEVFENMEMPLVPILGEMERRGVLIDCQKLMTQSQELAKSLQVLETEIYQMAGQNFNINSPKQLQEILYTELKLPILEKTPTGQPSTAESVMQELALEFPLPKLILGYRSLSKLKSTYTDKLPEQRDLNTGRVHTSYHQAVTATGRLSSSDPNLQNIPIRTEEGRKIRSAFIAPVGYKIVAADYSQIELRIMAHLSQDPALLKAFNNGEDIHKSTAATVYNIPLDEVTATQRRNAKIINFGLMYGMSGFGLAKQLGMDRKEADKEITRYFTHFPSVKIFMEDICRKAVEQGYVETLLGRRLYLPDIKSRNAGSRRAAERAAINAPMQGTNADIIKLSMIKIDQWLKENNLNAYMIMQVHDELVFEVSEKEIDIVTTGVKEIMENIIRLSIPLQVGIGVGNNWDEAH